MRNSLKLVQLFLICSLLVVQLQAQIKIVSPDTLIDKFKKENENFNNTIEVSIANFGSVPYGKTLIGPVFLSDPLTACDQINLNKYQMDDKKVNRDAAPIVIAERGECTFVEKAHYAQLAGAKLLIIVDDHSENIANIIMVEDGYGDIIKIPVVLVSKINGDKIMSELKDGEKHVEIKISFAAAEKNSTVDVQFWLNIENRDSYRLIRNFQKTRQDLGDKINFQPHYQVYQQSLTYLSQKDNNCIYNGKYCMNKPEGNSKNSGQDILKEIVRQLCIYEINPNLWWKYMDRYDQQCVKATTSDMCGEQVLTKVEIDIKKIKNCIKKSINSTDTVSEDEFNEALIKNDNYKLATEKLKSSSIYFWPTVVVGSQTYKGNLDPEDILEDICNSMKDPVSSCKQFLQGTSITSQNQQTGTGKVILIVISILVVFFFFMIFVYKRMAKRELSREMSSQVNQMVSQYIAFYESKGKNENI